MFHTKVNKRNFLIAVASRGISMSQFARSLKITPQSVDGFFNGKCPSRKISAAMELLIKEEFGRLHGETSWAADETVHQHSVSPTVSKRNAE
jgi:hypothetical protein